MNKKSLGFTLIELLVVVAIISLLSSVVLASVREVRDRAQQSAWRQYLSQYINALEIYRLSIGDAEFNSFLQAHMGHSDDSLYTLDEIIQETDLKQYIQWQTPPAFVTEGPSLYTGIDNICEPVGTIPEDDNYIVFFRSDRTDLNFRKTTKNASVDAYESLNEYCLSVKNR